jgi:hypothetical protein
MDDSNEQPSNPNESVSIDTAPLEGIKSDFDATDGRLSLCLHP